MAELPDSSKHYINTMVFAIIAGIVSLMLLLMIMLASDSIKEYSVFVITVEVGLTFVIVAAIVRIVARERAAYKSARNGLANKLAVDTCPDYWMRNNDLCTSAYQSQDPTLHGVPTPTFYMNGQTGTTVDPPRILHLNLSDYNNKSIADVCDKTKALGYSWTDVRAVCDSYRL
jgi:hypothetical protein